jgi:hypothetical protein
MAISIQPINLADTPGLARTLMSAWYEDPHWRALWLQTPVLEALIHMASEGMSWSLVNSESRKRYKKAVDTATGEIVGYVRWVLPPVLDGENI